MAEQRKDSSLQPLWEVAENDRREEDRVENDNNEQIKVENGLLYRDRTGNGEPVKQLVVPQSYRMKLLSLVHGSPLAAHLGRRRTKEKLGRRFYLPGMSTAVN